MDYFIDTDAINEIFKFPAYTEVLFEWLDEIVDSGKLVSVDLVKYEIMRRKPSEEADRLKDWVRKNEAIFLPPSNAIANILGTISDWTSKLAVKQEDRDNFNGGADATLIASAKYHNCTVVSNEKPARSEKELKIPDVCDHFNVKHTNLHGLLYKEGHRFRLVKYRDSKK